MLPMAPKYFTDKHLQNENRKLSRNYMRIREMDSLT